MVSILQRECCAKDHQRCLNIAQRRRQRREKGAAVLGLDLVLALEERRQGQGQVLNYAGKSVQLDTYEQVSMMDTRIGSDTVTTQGEPLHVCIT